MKLTRPDLAAYVLVALCLVLVTALVILGKPVPELLQLVTVTALGAGAGVASQNSIGSTPAAADVSEPAAAAPATPAAVARPVAAPPVPLTAEPATGVFRAVTHAP